VEVNNIAEAGVMSRAAGFFGCNRLALGNDRLHDYNAKDINQV